MKYLLYRSFGNLEKDVKKHELVAVEYGKDIDDVADALIKAAADDLAGMPEYERCETAAYPPHAEKYIRELAPFRYISSPVCTVLRHRRSSEYISWVRPQFGSS